MAFLLGAEYESLSSTLGWKEVETGFCHLEPPPFLAA